MTSKPRAKFATVFCNICDEQVSTKSFSRHKRRYHPDDVSNVGKCHVDVESQGGDSDEDESDENDEGPSERLETENKIQSEPSWTNIGNPMPATEVKDSRAPSFAAENAKLKAELEKCQIESEKWRNLYYRVDADNAILRKKLRGKPIQWIVDDDSQPEVICNGHVEQRKGSNEASAKLDDAHIMETSSQQEFTERVASEQSPLPAHAKSLHSGDHAPSDLKVSEWSMEISPMKNHERNAAVQESGSFKPSSVHTGQPSSASACESTRHSEHQSVSNGPEEYSPNKNVLSTSLRKASSTSTDSAYKKRKRGIVTDAASRSCKHCDQQGMNQYSYVEHMKSQHPGEFRPPEGPCPIGGRLECDTHGWVARLSWKRHWENRHHGEARPETVWFRDERDKESLIYVESRNRERPKTAKIEPKDPQESPFTPLVNHVPMDTDVDQGHEVNAQASRPRVSSPHTENHITVDDSPNLEQLKGEWSFLNDESFEWKMIKRDGVVEKSPFHPKLDFPFGVEKSDMWNKLKNIGSITVNGITYNIDDDVYVFVYNSNEEPHDEPARLTEIRALSPQRVYIRVYYYYRHDGINLPARFKEQLKDHPQEVVATSWTQILEPSQLNGKVRVERWVDGMERPIVGEGELYWQRTLDVWEEEAREKAAKSKKKKM